MLYTCSLSAFKKSERKLKSYFIMKQHGNEMVVPDQSDFDQYKNGLMPWQGFKLNYLSKLMRPEAEKWMKNIASESVTEDVVLVSDEENLENYYRIMLTEMIVNMFSGHMKIIYKGEIKEG